MYSVRNNCALNIAYVHGKNDLESKILLDKSENNVVGTLKIMSKCCKKILILATSLSVLRNYFDSSKLLF